MCADAWVCVCVCVVWVCVLLGVCVWRVLGACVLGLCLGVWCCGALCVCDCVCVWFVCQDSNHHVWDGDFNKSAVNVVSIVLPCSPKTWYGNIVQSHVSPSFLFVVGWSVGDSNHALPEIALCQMSPMGGSINKPLLDECDAGSLPQGNHLPINLRG